MSSGFIDTTEEDEARRRELIKRQKQLYGDELRNADGSKFDAIKDALHNAQGGTPSQLKAAQLMAQMQTLSADTRQRSQRARTKRIQKKVKSGAPVTLDLLQRMWTENGAPLSPSSTSSSTGAPTGISSKDTHKMRSVLRACGLSAAELQALVTLALTRWNIAIESMAWAKDAPAEPDIVFFTRHLRRFARERRKHPE